LVDLSRASCDTLQVWILERDVAGVSGFFEFAGPDAEVDAESAGYWGGVSALAAASHSFSCPLGRKNLHRFIWSGCASMVSRCWQLASFWQRGQSTGCSLQGSSILWVHDSGVSLMYVAFLAGSARLCEVRRCVGAQAGCHGLLGCARLLSSFAPLLH